MISDTKLTSLCLWVDSQNLMLFWDICKAVIFGGVWTKDRQFTFWVVTTLNLSTSSRISRWWRRKPLKNSRQYSWDTENCCVWHLNEIYFSSRFKKENSSRSSGASKQISLQLLSQKHIKLCLSALLIHLSLPMSYHSIWISLKKDFFRDIEVWYLFWECSKAGLLFFLWMSVQW